MSGDFPTLQDGVQKAVMSTVKCVNALAAGDIDFQRSSDGEFASAADATSARILALVNSLLKNAAAGSDIEPPTLRDADDVDNKWGDVVEVVDYLLERADTCLDEYTGAIKQKNPEPLPGAKNANPRLSRSQQKTVGFRATANSPQSRNLAKPQLLFNVKPDNLNDAPFKPLLTEKPHAKIPLEKSLEMFTNELGNKQYMHPYVEEIKTMKYPDSIFQIKEPQEYLPFEETTAILVDTPEALAEMLEELKKATEIAVDLEHHDQRSYIGIVCLMQISTREKDWILDTLQLREDLQVLNQVFADPNIIKVFHGAAMDIIWLQRDLGLYVVGLFDTYWACRSLGFAGHGLAFLLKKYIDFDADKQYQLADWRLRPLPEEMFNYARSDTHFLLYIFDCVRNELLERSDLEDPDNKMADVLENSKIVALRLYEKEPYDAVTGHGLLGWRNMLGRSQENLNPMQVSVFKAVHEWRDTTARIEDESPHFVMPRSQLLNLARKMPVDVAGVLGCCPRTSPPVRSKAGELVVVIRKAKDTPEVRAWQNSRDEARAAEAAAKAAKADAAAQAAPATTESESTTAADQSRVNIFTASSDEAKALREETSKFWGDCDDSSRWQQEQTSSTNDSSTLRLAVPLPQLTAEIFVSEDMPHQPQQTPAVDPGARAEHEYVKNRPAKEETSDVIVVRSLGGGRKRKLDDAAIGEVAHADATEDVQGEKGGTESVNGDDPASADALEQGALRKRKANKERKKKKKLAQQEEGEEEDAPVEGEEDAAVEKPTTKPFDYASAPSVLNQKREEGGRGKKKEKKKKAFNPYAGSANAPKGLSRTNQEKTGRSVTFKR